MVLIIKQFILLLGLVGSRKKILDFLEMRFLTLYELTMNYFQDTQK